jgi:mannobiose 2-epimerase
MLACRTLVTALIGCLGLIHAGPIRGWGADLPAGVHPGEAELRQQARRCREMLKRTVFDFYHPGCLDRANGGYLEDWKDGRFVARGEKFVTLQARQLWFFSTLAARNIEREKCLEAAVPGYVFLEKAFRDSSQGGYYAKVTDAGKPVDTRKHAYLNSFVLYGLVAYHEATKDRQALQRAKELFEVLESRAHDRVNGGYQEFFQADWTPVRTTGAGTYVGALGTKTYNTHLHLLEAFTALYRVWPDNRLRERLAELLRINMTTVMHPQARHNVDAWWPDWRMVDEPKNRRASYGHDVECLWLGMEAVRALGWPQSMHLGWARSLGDYCLEYGYDRDHGGFFYAGDPGVAADDTKKEWWVQAEALVGMLELYRATGEAGYYRAFVGTLDFVERHQVAKQGGGWWATLRSDGTASSSDSRSSMWQGAYHNGRALLLSATILDNLKPRTN